MPKMVACLLDVKIAHFLIDRETIFTIFGEVIPAIIAVAQNHAHSPQPPADGIGESGVGDEFLKSLLGKGSVERKGRERVAIFCAHQAVLYFEFQHGFADLAVQAAIPADTGFLPFVNTADVSVIIIHIGRIEIEIVDIARRKRGVKNARVTLDEHPHLSIVEVFDTEFALVAIFSNFGLRSVHFLESTKLHERARSFKEKSQSLSPFWGKIRMEDYQTPLLSIKVISI